MRKSIVGIILVAMLLTGCTSQEQKMQIRAFWQEQAMKAMNKYGTALMELYMKMMTKRMGGLEGMPTTMPRFSHEEMANNQPMTKALPLQDDDEALFSFTEKDTEAFEGVAPYTDRVKMKEIFDSVQATNQTSLTALSKNFNKKICDQILTVMIRNENKLKEQAKTTKTVQEFKIAKNKLLASQNTAIQNIIKANITNKNSLAKQRKTTKQ